MKPIYILITCLALTSCQKNDELQNKPIISKYGETYEISNPDFKTEINQSFKVVFDVGRRFSDEKPNALFNTAARYLNMHSKAGVSRNKMNVALVVHGAAAQDLLNNEKYREKFKVDNPNLGLLTALNNAGVDIILCGQTATHRNITKKDIAPEVQISLSAMTALVTLQNKGYRLINF